MTPTKSRLCIKPSWAWWTIGLTPKAILCSYSQFCPDGLFLLLLFYWSLPVQSPSSFSDISVDNVYYVWGKQNLSCAEAQQQLHSCRMLLVWVLLQTLAVLPLTSVGLKPHPSSRSSLTVAIPFLHSPSYFLPAMAPGSLGREDIRVRKLCEQPALLNPMSQQYRSASGTTYGIREASSLGCVCMALDTSSGGATACRSAVLQHHAKDKGGSRVLGWTRS